MYEDRTHDPQPASEHETYAQPTAPTRHRRKILVINSATNSATYISAYNIYIYIYIYIYILVAVVTLSQGLSLTLGNNSA